ncbi:hypothetical protein E4U60_001757 [Claviceps pazoutovae]|uniref:Uncharacterized protein n=1 Tax=Claviceps pazoutovae TaxID=1649127 RepID=A0A9P7MCH2_9HYPO|nr:hypothetical protein E4U60_001757 [Claviceps pazoutovae]
MHAKSWVLASALAMITSVIAEQAERPRIYFPREIKREYTNTTIAKPISSAPNGGPTTTKLSSTAKTESTNNPATDAATSKPPPLTNGPKTTWPFPDVVTSGSGLPIVTLLPTTKNSESRTTPSTSKKETPSDPATSKPPSPTNGPKTTWPFPNVVTSGSGLPIVTLLPTTKNSESRTTPSTSKKEMPSDPAIVIGPTGIVSSSNGASTIRPQPTSGGSNANLTSTGDATHTRTTSHGSKLNQISDGFNTAPTSDGSKAKTTGEGLKAKPTFDAPPTANATTPVRTTSSSDRDIFNPIGTIPSSSLAGPSTSASHSHTHKPSEPPVSMNTTDSAPTTGVVSRTSSNAKVTPSTTGPLPENSHSSQLPTSTAPLPTGFSTTTNSTTEPTTPPKNLPTTGPTTLPTTVPTTEPTSTKPHSGHHHSSSTSSHPIGGSSTTPDPAQSLPNNTATDVSMTKTPSGSPTPTILPTTNSEPPATNKTSTNPPTSEHTKVPTTGPVSVSISATDISMTNGTATAPTASQTLPLTSGSNNATGIVTGSATGSATNSQPTLTGSKAGTSSNTAAHTQTNTPSNSQTTLPTNTEPQTPASITPTTKPIVTSIRPTATVSNTDWLPTTIVIEPTTFAYTTPTTTPTGTTSQPLPSSIPKFIYPDDPNKPAPEGTVPIQIGFLFPLNYIFVSSNTVAAAQIFKFLPIALADASGIALDKLQISKLVPYNTQSTFGYVTTLAQLNYPATLVDTLQMDLWSPNSAIYNNDDPIVRNLTALINPNIDIHGNINGGGSNGGGAGGSGGSNNGGGNRGNNDAFGSGNHGDQSSKQKATTAGIAIAALGFSAMYGAAMFIVARRYKRKRQSHRRSSSVNSSPASSEMRYNGDGSPALMGGALMSHDSSTSYGAAGARDSHGSGGNSARTANISAPMATENSLGWN